MLVLQLNTELTTFQRRYVPQIKRCDEMERMLRFFSDELKKNDVTPRALQTSSGVVEHFKQNVLELQAGDSADTNLREMENFLTSKYDELISINEQLSKLTTTHNEHVELKEVLRACLKLEIERGPQNPSAAFSEGASIQSSSATNNRPLLTGSTAVEDFGFQYLCGVVPATEKMRFDRMIFRATRGNVMSNFFPIETPILDPTTGEQVSKLVFILVFKSEAIERKLRKLCDAHNAKQYGVNPRNGAEIELRLRDMESETLEQTRVLAMQSRAQIEMLQRIAQSQETWQLAVRREKAIYHSLNFFRDDIGGMLKAEGWVIKGNFYEVEDCIKRAHEESGGGGDMPCSVHESDEFPSEPPTHYKLDKFSAVFQALVDTYGTPRYREINPSVFTGITFPFLFGVMYGDVGHGSCLLLAGLYLVMTESQREGKRLGELMGGLHLGRYLILLMGVFAVYNGFIYNDFFALSLDIFGSGKETNSQWEFTCPCQPFKPLFKPAQPNMGMPTTGWPANPWTHEQCEALPAMSDIPSDGGCTDILPTAEKPWVCSPSCCCGGPDSSMELIMTKGSVAVSRAKTHLAVPRPDGSAPAGVTEYSSMGGFDDGYVYPFGLDPLWKGTSNELAMFNSFKMKISVILGIAQMGFGICLKGVNAILARDGRMNDSMLDFWWEFLPQIGFCSCLFFYMIFLIFLKWSINWEYRMGEAFQNDGKCPDHIGDKMCQPPSLINTLINIALAPGSCDEAMYPGQGGIQAILLLVAVACVPAMLVVKVCAHMDSIRFEHLSVDPLTVPSVPLLFVCCRCAAHDPQAEVRRLVRWPRR